MPSRILILIALLMAASAARARTGLTPEGRLDTASLRDAYLQSDIPMVRSVLEGFMKDHPKVVDRSERIFTHLYLGAIYAGEASGRAHALGHFRALLKIDPLNDPAAMYFTPQVRALFDEAKAGLPRAAVTAPAAPRPAPAPARNALIAGASPRSTAPAAAPAVAARAADRNWIWWTVGSAVAAVGAGVGIYALVAADSDPGPRRVDVDATLK